MAQMSPLTLTLLVICVTALSCTGPLLHKIEVAPALKAAWRMQANCLFCVPFFLYQLRTADERILDRMKQMHVIFLLLCSGFLYFIFMSTFVWALDNTSLPHTLLFMGTGPLLVVFGMFLLGKNLHKFELIGAICTLVGVSITLTDSLSKSDPNVSIVGDFVAFIAAFAIVSYMTLGRVLRTWMPLFIYTFLAWSFSAILLSVYACIDGAQLSGPSKTHLFGWAIPSKDNVYVLWVGLLVLIPGVCGAIGINYCLKLIDSLTASIGITFKPVIGSFVGWMIGASSVPSIWTFGGGPIIIIGAIIVQYGQKQKAKALDAEKSKKKKKKGETDEGETDDVDTCKAPVQFTKVSSEDITTEEGVQLTSVCVNIDIGRRFNIDKPLEEGKPLDAKEKKGEEEDERQLQEKKELEE